MAYPTTTKVRSNASFATTDVVVAGECAVTSLDVPASASITTPTTFEVWDSGPASATIALFAHEQGTCFFTETPVFNPSVSTYSWLSRTDLTLTITKPALTEKSVKVSFTYKGRIDPAAGRIISAKTPFEISLLQRACMTGDASDGKGTYTSSDITTPKYGTSTSDYAWLADAGTTKVIVM